MSISDAKNVGALAAVQAAVQALIRTHPDAAALRAALEQEAEVVRALWLAMPGPEEALRSFDAAMTACTARLADTTR